MKREFNVDHFLVAFIDVLGQSNIILENSVYPPSKQDLEKIKHNLQDTSEFIVALRLAFKNHFKKYRKLKDVLEGLPKKQKIMEQRLRTINTEILGISDSIIISVPLENKTDNYIPINNIRATLQGVSLIYNIALAKQKPVRGGVDVGWGTKLSQNEIYGSALVKAYSLENEKAEYPRIIVGESLWKYINYVYNSGLKTEYGKRARKIADECKKMIIKDYDNQYVLNVLDFRLFTYRIVEPRLINEGYEFILNFESECKKKGDHKLLLRYQRLRKFYETRAGIWRSFMNITQSYGDRTSDESINR